MNNENKLSNTFIVSRALLWLLRFSILIQVAVQSWMVTRYGSSINSYFFSEHHVLDETLMVWDKIGAIALLLCCFGLFHKKFIHLMWLVSMTFLLLAIFTMIDNGSRFAPVTPWAHSVRIMIPLCYWFVVKENRWLQELGLQVFRWAVAITFIVHGIECLLAHGDFIDYIIGSGDKLLGLAISEAQAVNALKAIGVFDIVLSILLLCRRWKRVAFHMFIWGAVAALSRVTSGEFEYNWYKSLVRVANSTGPLVIYLWWGSNTKD